MDKFLSRPSFFQKLYDWLMAWSDKPQARKALGWFSFAESIIFPIPPDPLLMAMVFARPKQWLRYAFITSAASIAGGVVGYVFGVGLFETVGQWIISSNGLENEYAELGRRFSEGTFIAVLAAAVTPIPFKLVTIAAGAFQVNFIIFLLAALVGRPLRFFGVSYLAHYLGKSHRHLIERYINIVSYAVVLVALLVLFVAAR